MPSVASEVMAVARVCSVVPPFPVAPMVKVCVPPVPVSTIAPVSTSPDCAEVSAPARETFSVAGEPGVPAVPEPPTNVSVAVSFSVGVPTTVIAVLVLVDCSCSAPLTTLAVSPAALAVMSRPDFGWSCRWC